MNTNHIFPVNDLVTFQEINPSKVTIWKLTPDNHLRFAFPDKGQNIRYLQNSGNIPSYALDMQKMCGDDSDLDNNISSSGIEAMEHYYMSEDFVCLSFDSFYDVNAALLETLDNYQID